MQNLGILIICVNFLVISFLIYRYKERKENGEYELERTRHKLIAIKAQNDYNKCQELTQKKES